MSWLTGQRGASTYICPEDRYVSKSDIYDVYAEGQKLKIQGSYTCPACNKNLVNMGMRWRAPKRTNDKAWKRIQKGDIWWDDKAINSKLNKARNKWQPWSGKKRRPRYYSTQTQYVRRESQSIEYNNSHLEKYFAKQMTERRG